MASSFDPFAANDPFAATDPFASSPGYAPPAAAPASPTPASYQQQQDMGNPFAVYSNQTATQQPPAPASNQPAMMNNSMVPVAAHHQQNQWAVQQQTQTSPPASGSVSVGGYNPNPQAHLNGYPQPQQYNMQMQQAPVSPNAQPAAHQHQQAMVASPSQSNGYMMPPNSPHGVGIPQQQPTQQLPAANMHAPVSPAPVPVAPPPAPPAAVTDDDIDFFGDFSNNAPAKTPVKPLSSFDASQNDDVSYLSKSTNGGLSERQPTNGKSPLDDPKFAPKPRPPEGLANALALSQEAPASASPLPDFNMITHSGYTLARISFRTILIKKWKQIFWVTYGDSRVLFFRSVSDFEDWISNPYLSQPQRDFLVKLNIDFVGDIGKQSVRGYQVTNQRLKNYNNRMLHQFKLERWMDYGPTIAAAFASPNEREVYNIRTVFTEMMKRAPQTKPQPSQRVYASQNDSYSAPGGRNSYGQSPVQNRQPFQYPSSASAGGRYDTGASSVYSGYSGRSHQSHPADMRHDPNNEYVGGYRVVTSNSRY